jgi:GT2 family glycosyltransferase
MRAPADTVAVVLTHRRRRLATALVRSLIAEEGFPPERIVLVVDREGGLEDPTLEASIRLIRLETNSGPAAGFRAGLDAAFEDREVTFAYLCEDDVGLLGLPAPRVASLRATVEEHESTGGTAVGAVVAYGRRFHGRRGVTDPFAPDPTGPRLQPVDVAAWGATLVSRRVVDAGVRPDDLWFFGYEDFDFFLRVRARGLAVLADRDSALAVSAATATLAGRDAALSGQRPDDAMEAWRAYYVARNFFELARRHGDLRWLLWHLIYSARRFQLATTWSERRAMLIGLSHGLVQHYGRHPRYVRAMGELPSREATRNGPVEKG